HPFGRGGGGREAGDSRDRRCGGRGRGRGGGVFRMAGGGAPRGGGLGGPAQAGPPTRRRQAPPGPAASPGPPPGRPPPRQPPLAAGCRPRTPPVAPAADGAGWALAHGTQSVLPNTAVSPATRKRGVGRKPVSARTVFSEVGAARALRGVSRGASGWRSLD